MATIRFRRGTTDPTASIQPTGLTMGEPVFNRELNKFWIGGSGPDGFTAIWVGAEIENTLSLENASPYKLATQYAIVNQIKTIVGASAGVQTIEGLSGQIDLVFGTGISGSTSPGAITLQNTGVTRLGFTGSDANAWKYRGVTSFGAPGTGGVTLGAELWAGTTPVQLNSGSVGGLSNGTSLTGKTPMEILELLLIQYLNPTISWDGEGMDFTSTGSPSPASWTNTRTSFAFGMTADGNNSFGPRFDTTNGTNLDGSKGITISATITSGGGMTGSTGVIRSQIFGSFTTSNNTFTAFGVTSPYKGISYSSIGQARAIFTITGTDINNNTITSNTKTYNWYPRYFSGRTSDTNLLYPPDNWKAKNTFVSGNTSGKLMTSDSPTDPQETIEFPAGASNQYLYFWIDSYYSPNFVKDSSGQEFALLGGGTASTLVTGVTLDDDVSTRVYRRYRSLETQTSAYTLKLQGT